MVKRVEHPSRGTGTVKKHQAVPPMKVWVAFDMGESHAYQPSVWGKLQPIGTFFSRSDGEGGGSDGGKVTQIPARLRLGARVEHPIHGPGTINNLKSTQPLKASTAHPADDALGLPTLINLRAPRARAGFRVL